MRAPALQRRRRQWPARIAVQIRREGSRRTAGCPHCRHACHNKITTLCHNTTQSINTSRSNNNKQQQRAHQQQSSTAHERIPQDTPNSHMQTGSCTRSAKHHNAAFSHGAAAAAAAETQGLTVGCGRLRARCWQDHPSPSPNRCCAAAAAVAQWPAEGLVLQG